MRIVLIIAAALASLALPAHAAGTKFFCGNSDYTITADFSGPATAPTFLLTWPTFSQTFVQDQLHIFPGEALWPELPNTELKQWPYGAYVAKDKAKDLTVIVNVLRPASAGGGGYSYEGTISISAKDNDPVVYAVYCNL